MIKPATLVALLRTLQPRDPTLTLHGPPTAVDPVSAVRAIEASEARPRTNADPQPLVPRADPRRAPGETRPAAAAIDAYAAHGGVRALGFRDPDAGRANGAEAPRLSPTALLLSHLTPATASAAAALAAPPAGTPKGRPLLAARPAAPSHGAGVPVPELAQALARAVGESGVFYEAHLAAWADNRLPQAALAAEPQAHWPRETIADGAGALATANANASATPAEGARSDGEAPPLAPAQDTAALPPLVQRQIATLETGEFVWQGQVWPGQSAEIAFAEETPRRERDGPAAAAWRTRMSLALPELGRTTIELVLAGSRLDLAITADGAEADARLKAGGPDLVAALAARTLALSALSIRHAP